MKIRMMAAALLALAALAAGADYRGEVRFGGQAVPGAMVTLTNSATKLTVATDAAGRFEFKDVETGAWTVTVEMPCFATASREASGSSILLNLELLPESTPCVEPVTSPMAPAAVEPPAPAPAEARERPLAGYLINGSVDNAADSDMAQPAAFGNFRHGSATYYASLLATLDTSALDAAPYSLVGATARPPSRMLATGSATVSGPLIWWRHTPPDQSPYFILSYERTRNRVASVANGRVPTAAERGGDFSLAGGQPTDPLSGLPFPGGVIPGSRISAQAESLLRLYPSAGTSAASGYNLEAPVIRGWHRDAWKVMAMTPVGRGSLIGEFATESVRTDESTLFGFLDRGQSGGTKASLAWVPGRPEAWQGRFTVTFERQYERSLPFFADVRDVAGEAGIAGSSQRPADWGPPSLSFSSGVSGLSDAVASNLETQSVGVSATESGSFGPWQVDAGLSFARRQRNQLGLINPRGSFGFTGAATGVDLADFLLGLPGTASLATGSADRYLRANEWAAYVATEWRPTATLTVNAGGRWEYATPYVERYGRLANLTVAPGFAAAQVDPAPAADGALVRPFQLMIEPRVSLAWLPFMGSSLVVRAGYGIYADTGVYESIASSLAAQPPFGRNFAIRSTPGAPLTMATALTTPGDALGTFGVDGRFRPGYAQNWHSSVERDLVWGLVAKVGYLGIKGTHARQAIYPNTCPAGGAARCLSCPSGFEYILSGGNSSRQAGQLDVRRRLRGGWSVKSQTTWAKSIDNAALGGGAQPALVAQNWADLASERALSSFDRRFTERLTADYTFRFASGWLHRLLDEWRLASDLTIGTGLPLTPLYAQAIGGAGFIGNLRPDYTGAPLRNAPEGLHVNPAAFMAPASGQWGNAGRNTITGPGQFALNAGLWRTLRLGSRTSADLRVDVTNLLNHPTFTRWDTTLDSVLFGRPVAVNAMRSVKLGLEVRY